MGRFFATVREDTSKAEQLQRLWTLTRSQEPTETIEKILVGIYDQLSEMNGAFGWQGASYSLFMGNILGKFKISTPTPSSEDVDAYEKQVQYSLEQLNKCGLVATGSSGAKIKALELPNAAK